MISSGMKASALRRGERSFSSFASISASRFAGSGAAAMSAL
jgi:hypothetical protein